MLYVNQSASKDRDSVLKALYLFFSTSCEMKFVLSSFSLLNINIDCKAHELFSV